LPSSGDIALPDKLNIWFTATALRITGLKQQRQTERREDVRVPPDFRFIQAIEGHGRIVFGINARLQFSALELGTIVVQ
jgi:hypothetical protein